MTQEISKIAKRQFTEMIQEYPEQEGPGGDLFLGKCFAANDVVHLGLNPGLEGNYEFKTNLLDTNVLLNDGAAIKYWKHAAIALTANPILKEKFEHATYSFCCPFRTKLWSPLPAKKKRGLLEYSIPIFEALLKECEPNYIVVSGVASKNIILGNFGSLFSEVKEIDSKVYLSPKYQWCAYRMVFNGKPMKLIQAPHFSYANSRERLLQFSDWLTKELSS